MAKTDNIIRRVVLGKTYNIFSMKVVEGKPQMELLEQEVSYETRPTDAELCKKHKVDKVILMVTGTTIGHYGVDVDKFMELATLVKTEVKKVDEDKEAETKTEA